MRFTYSLVRYVPHAERGEFLNVGAIVMQDGRVAGTRYEFQSAERLRAVGGDRSFLSIALTALLDQVKTEEDVTVRLMDSRSALRLSTPLPLLASSARNAMAMVIHTFLEPK